MREYPDELTSLPDDLIDGVSVPEGGWTEDVLEDARRAVVKVMRGQIKRGAIAILNAAKLILAADFLTQISDQALLAEVRRRAGSFPQDGPVENER